MKFLLLLLLGCCVCQNVLAQLCTSASCSYTFNVRREKTMTYKDATNTPYDVVMKGKIFEATARRGPPIVRNLTANDLLVADGFPRYIITINHGFPGPIIEVMEGAEIVVAVTNMMSQSAISVHWHGIFQRGTNWADGTTYVTQCPIHPMQSFTYRFKAFPAGTHMYHSHQGTQMSDGLFGLLIVHKAAPTTPYFGLFVQDWSHIDSDKTEINNPDACENGAIGARYKTPFDPVDCTIDGAGIPATPYVSSLLGNRGRFGNQNQFIPLAEYSFTSGLTHRFHFSSISAYYPFEVSIDGHMLSIVASDGNDIVPITVNSFFIFPGETITFDVIANQPAGRYWFRADTPCAGKGALAIIAYNSYANDTNDPNTKPFSCNLALPCTIFNCPFGNYPASYNRKCITMADARSTLPASVLTDTYGVGLAPTDYDEYFLNFGMVVGSSVNARRFAVPPVPVFQPDGPASALVCPAVPCAAGCKCQCAQILTLPFNRTIQLVITNMQPDVNVIDDGYHPIHLHGNNFAVLAQGFPTYDPVTGRWTTPNADISCGTDTLCANPKWGPAGRPAFNVANPPIKDTLLLPIRGYSVVRFKTTNPGYWLMHCHIEMHMQEGMMILLNVAPGLHPTYPAGFPSCSPHNN